MSNEPSLFRLSQCELLERGKYPRYTLNDVFPSWTFSTRVIFESREGKKDSRLVKSRTVVQRRYARFAEVEQETSIPVPCIHRDQEDGFDNNKQRKNPGLGIMANLRSMSI